MAITSKQFDQLTEMGISLWQSRGSDNTDNVEKESYQLQNQQSLTALTKQVLFGDILRSLNLTIGEVKAQNDHLDVGLFNWYFIDEKLHKEQLTINCIENKLISPSLEIIAQSASLKRQLWQTIARNLL